MKKFGLIFQQFHLISYLTALENVMVAQYYHSMIDEKEALEALRKVGLADRAKHLPKSTIWWRATKSLYSKSLDKIALK